MLQTETLHAGSYIGGEEIKYNHRNLKVLNPYNQEVIGKISPALVDDVEKAILNADKVFHETMKHMPAYERSEILRKTADLLEKRAQKFAEMLSLEAGKPIQESRGEVTRAVQVLRFASEGAKSIYGEQISLDSAIGGENQMGVTKRIPLGVIAAITPFNFPLNLVLHKVAPAIATGNTVVLKPAEKTPFSSVLLYQLLEEAGLPKGALNILMGPGQELVEPLVTHPKVRKVTFTGSGKVGWMIKEMAPRKRVTLELGSNAPNIIFADADVEQATQAIAMGGYTFAGQACVSAQRVYVERSIHDAFVKRLVTELQKLKTGNPLDEGTSFGPMITEDAAIRAESWINEAVGQGAKVAIGGKRDGAVVEPTVITDVDPDMKVVCAEVFAPIVSILPFETEEEVIASANDSEFGLHAGVFTKDIYRAFRVADAIDTGGVWINEVSVRRYDHIPYGGVKNSGIGKEGIKYAIDDMTAIKFIGINLKS
ncbi:aldehyde dehydrogenase family protein [Oceanobacillus alkalisoli]|uniref:aldehyde dehydrogenase family protein n=1 Tax=Oceanobacillus alkalisoli TaxID=2925113 RepID=UPI001EF02FA5|nr:aldehyde dehydrogenase family protein [Oceanobacillus alkalisoli]MCF3944375.1 aldehyde dehydrogenase family protein [Oceanobacillus alkalisoli]MCG5102163.1 aldehyde dehydrogenase family protein [Oceanobacillus alkalisoli]